MIYKTTTRDGINYIFTDWVKTESNALQGKKTFFPSFFLFSILFLWLKILFQICLGNRMEQAIVIFPIFLQFLA